MDGAIQLTAKLEKLHRSAFPSAVRNTLNDAAFNTKKLIPKVANQKFTTRSKTLFKVMTGANRASGFNVNTMHSSVGILSNLSNRSELAEGLSKQETGGTVDGRKLIPHRMGRVSSSHQKRLRSKYRFRKIKITTNKRKGDSNIILIKKGNKGTVFERKKLKSRVKLTPIFHYRSNNKSTVKRTPFIEPSAKLIARKMPDYYKNNAEFQFKKVWK